MANKRSVAVVCPQEVFWAFTRMIDRIDCMDSRRVETGGTEYLHVCESFDVEGRWFDDALFLTRWYEVRLIKHMTVEQFREIFVRNQEEKT